MVSCGPEPTAFHWAAGGAGAGGKSAVGMTRSSATTSRTTVSVDQRLRSLATLAALAVRENVRRVARTSVLFFMERQKRNAHAYGRAAFRRGDKRGSRVAADPRQKPGGSPSTRE